MWFGGCVALPVFLRQRVCFGGVCDMAYVGVGCAGVEFVLLGLSVGLVASGLVAKKKQEVFLDEKDPEGSVGTLSIDFPVKN